LNSYENLVTKVSLFTGTTKHALSPLMPSVQMQSNLLVPEFSLTIDLAHLQAFDPELANMLSTRPNDFLPWVRF
jgi:hypothetical protein